MENITTCSAPKAWIQGLDAYRVAVEFYRLLRDFTRSRHGHVIDQTQGPNAKRRRPKITRPRG